MMELQTCWVTPDGTVLPTRAPPAARTEVQARDPMAVSQPAGAVSPGVCSSAGSTGTAPVSPVDK